MKYTVYLMTPYCAFAEVEADSEEEAIAQCDYPPEFDLNEGSKWVAVEEAEEQCAEK